jgi:hypothetical protein
MNWRKVFAWEENISEVPKSQVTRKDWGGFGTGRAERSDVLQVGKRYFRFLRPISYRSMKVGNIYGDSYHATNAGYDVFEFLGYSDIDEKYGEGGVKFQSINEVYRKYGVRSLQALTDKCYEIAKRNYGTDAYGHDIYMWEKFLEETMPEPGGYYYIFEGRWCRGSGAEPLTFWEVEEVNVV